MPVGRGGVVWASACLHLHTDLLWRKGGVCFAYTW